jgi:hypothetical protein
MFGGGEFDAFFGDIGDHPITRRWISDFGINASFDILGDSLSNWMNETWWNQGDELPCMNLSMQLLNHLDALANMHRKALREKCREIAKTLCGAPGGLDLLEEIGRAYSQEGRQRTWWWIGAGALWARGVEKFNLFSSRVSLKLELGKILSMDDASGLDKLFLRIVWKFGKQLLGQRVRRACAMALDGAERPRRRALTSAMIQVRQLPSTHTS